MWVALSCSKAMGSLAKQNLLFCHFHKSKLYVPMLGHNCPGSSVWLKSSYKIVLWRQHFRVLNGVWIHRRRRWACIFPKPDESSLFGWIIYKSSWFYEVENCSLISLRLRWFKVSFHATPDGYCRGKPTLHETVHMEHVKCADWFASTDPFPFRRFSRTSYPKGLTNGKLQWHCNVALSYIILRYRCME